METRKPSEMTESRNRNETGTEHAERRPERPPQPRRYRSFGRWRTNSISSTGTVLEAAEKRPRVG
ncbi:hypothetical protein C9J85_16105 [Haloferax sp. wsp5]|nr:hypothetical protein C9J85_16105 [Haloferax sp. wsp5]